MKQSKTFEKRGWGGGDKWGIGERQINDSERFNQDVNSFSVFTARSPELLSPTLSLSSKYCLTISITWIEM